MQVHVCAAAKRQGQTRRQKTSNSWCWAGAFYAALAVLLLFKKRCRVVAECFRYRGPTLCFWNQVCHTDEAPRCDSMAQDTPNATVLHIVLPQAGVLTPLLDAAGVLTACHQVLIIHE